MYISLLLPTRNRPEWLQRFYDSVKSKAKYPDGFEVVVYIDNDDDSYDDMRIGTDLKIVRGPRIVLSEMWNKCQEAASGEIYGHMGDDIVMRTQHWDELVRKAFRQYEDRIVFAYGQDGLSPADFGTHGFIHKNWVDTVGYFVPPYFSSDYNDTWLNDVAKAINRHHYIPNLFTEHMHWTNNKSPKDITHKERIARHVRDRVETIYAKKQPERDADAKKLLDVIECRGNRTKENI